MDMQRSYAVYPIISAFLFLLAPHAYGQANKPAADAAYSALMKRARSEIQQHEQADRPAKADSAERAYAQDFFQFYLEHPDTEASSRASPLCPLLRPGANPPVALISRLLVRPEVERTKPVCTAVPVIQFGPNALVTVSRHFSQEGAPRA